MSAGAGYALAELLAGLLIGGFFRWGRAEALLFFALRPWLLLLAVLLAARLPLLRRALFYASGLGLAGVSQSLFLLMLGASSPWLEAAKGFAAGALLVAVLDGGVQLGRHFLGRAGAAVAAVAAIALFLFPGGLRPYEELVLGGAVARQTADKPDLMLVTGLPLIWGELGPLHPDSRPAAAFRMLEQEFRVRPLDLLDQASLGSGTLLLLAQPRALAPSELAALDTWVRAGGKVLILTDPALAWPSELPLGDIRRPPVIGLLAPLLEHWGLFLHGTEAAGVEARQVRAGDRDRRLLLLRPGRLESRSSSCALSEDGLLADCRIGSGRAIVVADADLLHDALWVGPAGAARHTRIADNPLFLADQLDSLSGDDRIRLAGEVKWLDSAADPLLALLVALLPLLLAATPALLRLRRRRG